MSVLKWWNEFTSSGAMVRLPDHCRLSKKPIHNCEFLEQWAFLDGKVFFFDWG
jgi:hypothetical protein